MAMSCFSGAMVASAANASANTKYHDQDLDFNSLGWPILNDEQACTALLDFVDLTLAQANIAPMNIDLSVLGSITIKLGSVDEVLKTVQDLDSFLNSKSALLLLAGDARYVDLSAVDGMSRSATSSTDIVRGIVKLVRNISSDAGPEGQRQYRKEVAARRSWPWYRKQLLGCLQDHRRPDRYAQRLSEKYGI